MTTTVYKSTGRYINVGTLPLYLGCTYRTRFTVNSSFFLIHFWPHHSLCRPIIRVIVALVNRTLSNECRKSRMTNAILTYFPSFHLNILKNEDEIKEEEEEEEMVMVVRLI